ncbi:hypothetical protein QBC34DRAFT_426132 [Podospora aff. communis PSN243]|uniref:Uncharacterized protein n=1 Tax=Podospora aff. communis PSN243 TaxID=3040156 RepID=A0AAV9GK24_9PEZI|nr:hypothetical protein QBC34DRAFT_426132 [Podospora aff. communis PSN243]
MKATMAIILTIAAALASASPSPNKAASLPDIAARQDCTYNCLCNDDKDPESELPDPDTAPCCASAGGSLGNGGTNFARCCGRSGGFTCFQSGNQCPPVTVVIGFWELGRDPTRLIDRVICKDCVFDF